MPSGKDQPYHTLSNHESRLILPPLNWVLFTITKPGSMWGRLISVSKACQKYNWIEKKYMCSTSEEKLIYTNLLSKKVKESQQEIDVIFIIKYAFLRLVRNKSRYSSKKYKFLANKSWAYGTHL